MNIDPRIKGDFVTDSIRYIQLYYIKEINNNTSTLV